MQLSKYFTLEEMTISQTATRNGLKNTPSPQAIENMKCLCLLTLDPVREAGGQPLVVSSGYRSVKVNALVGGSNTSQHCKGEAADCVMVGKTVLELMTIVMETHVEFDQMIYEFGRWMHISRKANGKNRRQIMRADTKKGKTVYTELHYTGNGKFV